MCWCVGWACCVCLVPTSLCAKIRAWSVCHGCRYGCWCPGYGYEWGFCCPTSNKTQMQMMAPSQMLVLDNLIVRQMHTTQHLTSSSCSISLDTLTLTCIRSPHSDARTHTPSFHLLMQTCTFTHLPVSGAVWTDAHTLSSLSPHSDGHIHSSSFHLLMHTRTFTHLPVAGAAWTEQLAGEPPA